MKNTGRKCGLLALVVLLCLWVLAEPGLGCGGDPDDCPPCPDCTHCGGAAANWQCVTNCNICEFECPCREYCQDPEGPNGTNNCQKCDLNLGCVGCDHWDDCEDCNRLVIPGGQCQSFCDPEDDCCHGQCCDYEQCLECNDDPDDYRCRSKCDPNETCCYGKCCNTKQCLECNGDPDDPNCRSTCDPGDECCYGTCCNHDQCLECNGNPDNPQCRSKCDPNACESCYGAEGCKDRCVRDHPDECLKCDGKGSCVSECDPNACELCYGAEGCDDRCTRNPNDCLKCDGEGGCICDAEIESVSASKEYVCVNEDVTFTADVDSRCDCVEWSGGGDPATADGTCSFVTKWTTAGAKCVHAVSPCSGGYKWVTVVEVDLDIYNGRGGSMVPDPNETNIGAYLLVNWDDDDDDDGPDMDETGTVDDEDDLARIVLYCSTASTGTLELVKTGSNIKIWQNETKGTEQTDLSWDLATELPPSTLWVEGRSASGAERDVELELKYIHSGNVVTSDTVKATVVMINLGNAVYRENKLVAQTNRGHSAIVYEYTGACTPTDLNNSTKFKIIEMDGPTNNRTLATITDDEDCEVYGCYTNTSDITYTKRLGIIRTAKVLVGFAGDITYAWDHALEGWNDEYPSKWNGSVSDIQYLRCDGLIEVCYEVNGIDVWAMERHADGEIISWNYDISDVTDELIYEASTHSWYSFANSENDNLEEHNDFTIDIIWSDTLMPATQCGHTTPVDAVTRFSKQDLCSPIGHTGGN